IVAGNAVIWKPATETPMMAYELAQIYEEAGLPQGVVNVVFGTGGDVGDAMVHHKDIKVISFTGSEKTGSHVAGECGQKSNKDTRTNNTTISNGRAINSEWSL